MIFQETEGTTGYLGEKMMNLNVCLIPYKNISCRWTIDLNVKAKVITSAENMWERFHNLSIAKDFLNSEKVHTRGKMANWNLKFLFFNDTIKR